jgi:hypothetical protein
VRASGTMLRQRVLADVPLAAETLVDVGHLAGIDQAVHETGVAVGDIALAAWSAGVAHEAVDGVLTSTPSVSFTSLYSLSLLSTLKKTKLVMMVCLPSCNTDRPIYI